VLDDLDPRLHELELEGVMILLSLPATDYYIKLSFQSQLLILKQ